MNCNWSAVSGAITYYLDISTVASFATFITGYNNLDVGNVTTYNATGLPGSVRYYRVRAASGCASGGNSNFIVADPSILVAPVATNATSITCTNMNANWQAAAGAIAYEIDVSTSSSFATIMAGYPLNVGNVLSYNITGLTINTFYYYRIRAVNACVTSTNSITITASTFAPNAPAASAATNLTCSDFNANWSAVSGAIGYNIDLSTDPAFGSFVGIYNNLNVGNTTSYNLISLSASTIYYYRIRARNGCSTSGYSNIVTAITTAPAITSSNTVTGFTCTSFVASWAAVSNATSYAIDVSNVASFATFITGYNNLNVGNVTSISVTGLSSGIIYYYRVRTINNCGTSGNSNVVSFIIAAPTIPVPSSSSISCSPAAFSACWSLSAGATNYFLDISTNASFTTFVSGYNNLSLGNVQCFSVSTNIFSGNNYYYRVRSANSCGSSGNSNNVFVTTSIPGIPSVTDVPLTEISCTSFLALWGNNGSAGTTTYFLDVSTSSSFGTFVGVFNDFNAGGQTSFNVTSLTAGLTYYYRVRSSNGCGTSLSSNTITVNTAAPVAPVATAASSLTSNSFTANWNAAPNATTYYLDVATDNLFTNFVTLNNNKNVGNVYSISVSGLSSGTTYRYRVRAANSCNTSVNSNTISLTTTP